MVTDEGSDQGTIGNRDHLINEPFDMVSKPAQENLETYFKRKNLSKSFLVMLQIEGRD
jgi:hypothetical protein